MTTNRQKGGVNAEIICIGTELLLGHIVNTNASFIADKLAGIGVDHYFQTTVGDNPKRLADTIRTGLARSDVVITTGGLGPTVDDITTRIIADVVNKKQALIPEGAKWLRNPYGTAPGLIITIPLTPTLSPKGRGIKGEGLRDKTIIALPGPPREMQPMMENLVIPYLRKKSDGNWLIKSKSIRLIGLAEAKVNEQVKDLLNLSGPVTLGIYAKQGEVELKIMAKAQDEITADGGIKKVEKIIRRKLNPYIYGVDKETLADNVVAALIKRKKTIAVAESCTGGLIANFITNAPGSSKVFIEGIVSYSNESKVKNLSVKAETLKKYGAVSPQAAREMAAGIRKKTGVDIGIGVTGIAGPTGATKTKPIGLVYIALSLSFPRKRESTKTIVRQFNFLGSRIEIKHQAAQAALDMIRLTVR